MLPADEHKTVLRSENFELESREWFTEIGCTLSSHITISEARPRGQAVCPADTTRRRRDPSR